MPVEKLNIPSLPEPVGFAHVGIASGSRLVFLAGQVAQDSEGKLVGAGDLAAQTEQAVMNVSAGLDAAGATFDDVAKTTIYVVDWETSKMEQLITGFGRAAARSAAQLSHLPRWCRCRSRRARLTAVLASTAGRPECDADFSGYGPPPRPRTFALAMRENPRRESSPTAAAARRTSDETRGRLCSSSSAQPHRARSLAE